LESLSSIRTRNKPPDLVVQDSQQSARIVGVGSTAKPSPNEKTALKEPWHSEPPIAEEIEDGVILAALDEIPRTFVESSSSQMCRSFL
jgi:hypothetical protein